MKTKSEHQAGFTLIEMLVVVGIIILLAALIFPLANRGMQRAHRATCASNLRQIGIAINGYLVDNRGYYPISATADFRAGSYGLVELLKDHLPFTSMIDHHGHQSEWVNPRHSCPMYYHRNRSHSPGSGAYGSYAYRHDFQGSNTIPPGIGTQATSLAGRLAGSLMGDRTKPKWTIHHWTTAEYAMVWDNGWNQTTLNTTPHAYHGLPAHEPYYNVLFGDGRVSQHRWMHRNGVIPTSHSNKVPPEFRRDEYRADP